MDTITGIPAHPLFVHVPVILVPLAALAAILMVIRPAWKQRYQWATLAIGFVGMVGAILAAGSGEELEEAAEREMEGMSGPRPWESHAEAGELARTVSIVFFVVLAAYVLIPWFLQRRARNSAPAAADPAPGASSAPAVKAGPAWLAPVLAAAVAVAAVGSVVTIIDAGHSGAKSVWSEEGGDGD